MSPLLPSRALLVPYRRGEFWAWWATWIPVAAMAVTFVVSPDAIGVTYLIVAAPMAVPQFLTLPRFRSSPAAVV